VLAYLVSDLLEIAEMLAPFLPDTAQAINNIFADGILRKSKTVLFPKIDTYTSYK
jgi:hypothetical protein